MCSHSNASINSDLHSRTSNESEYNMNFQPPTSGPQNQLYTQQQLTTSLTGGLSLQCLYNMSENIPTQIDSHLHGGSEFKYSKILKVKDTLLYYDQTPYMLSDNEVNNYLSNIIQAFKTQSTDSLNIANQLINLLRQYPGLVETYLTSNPKDYRTEGQVDESGYYFTVSIIANNSKQMFATAWPQDPYVLVISPPFMANPRVQSVKMSPYTFQSLVISMPIDRFIVSEPTPLPNLMFPNLYISNQQQTIQPTNITHTQNVSQTLHQEYIAKSKGKKRQRIN